METRPPHPATPATRRRLWLSFAGLRDRAIKRTCADGTTPVHQALIAESQKGELSVLAWYAEALADSHDRAPVAIPRRPPAGFPEHIWEARQAESAARYAAEADRWRAEVAPRREATENLARTALASWAMHYATQALIYDRARLGNRTRVDDWASPGYRHVALPSAAETSLPTTTVDHETEEPDHADH